MGLPTLTVSAIADAVEIWDIFWHATNYLNSGCDLNSDFDCGTVLGNYHDFTSSSKNLKPSKILWDVSWGHDHRSSSLSGPLKWHGFRKRHIDLNSAKILWQEFGGNSFDNQKFCIFTMGTTVTPGVDGTGSSALLDFSSPFVAGQDLSDSGTNDTSSDKWLSWSYNLGLSYIISVKAEGVPTYINTNLSVYMWYDTITPGWRVAMSNGTNGHTYSIEIMYFGWFIGTV